MKRQGYGEVEIAEAVNKATFTLPEDIAAPPPETLKPEQENYGPVEDYFDDGATDALVAELTEEDRLYLRLKWGKAYKPDEWIELEKLYKDMEVKMLTGSAQSYSLGSRFKTNYNMSLSEIRAAIQKLEEEIEELEGLISGTRSRKCVAIIPWF